MNSHWKLVQRSPSIYLVKKLDNEPSYFFEQFFVWTIITSFVWTMLTLAVSFLYDTTIGIRKLADLILHILVAVLVIVAGVLYIVSASQMGKLKLAWSNENEMKLGVAMKIVAGV